MESMRSRISAPMLVHQTIWFPLIVCSTGFISLTYSLSPHLFPFPIAESTRASELTSSMNENQFVVYWQLLE